MTSVEIGVPVAITETSMTQTGPSDVGDMHALRACGPQGHQQRNLARWFWIVIATMAALGFWAMLARQWSKTGWDFPVFYIAASLPRSSVYSYSDSFAFWQQHLAPLGVPHWARFVRLPAFWILLRPIALLSYSHALWAWITASLCAYFASITVLIRRFRLPSLLLPAFVAFFPAVAGLLSGQDNCLLLLGIIAAWMLLEKKRDALAGLAFALCLYKFNLIFLIPLLLLVHKRYRAFASFAIGAVCIGCASFLITPLGTYITALREVPKETAGFFPVGLRGLTWFFGLDWCYPVLALIVFLLCCWLMWRKPLLEGFCVAVICALLIVPYVCWYDSTLLLIPLALIYSRGSTRMRAACLAILLMIPAWPVLFTHVLVAMFFLLYFLRAVVKGIAISKPPLSAEPVSPFPFRADEGM